MFFYTGDWWKDLSAAAPEVRGIWFDLLCRMHDDHRSGIVVGTRDELAALARCTRKQFDDFILINSRLKFADVTLGNNKVTGIVTVKNRRMFREAQVRASVARRVSKSRREEMKQKNGGNVTQKVRFSLDFIIHK